MQKLTYPELRKFMWEHNERKNITCKGTDDRPLYGIIVFKSENWPDKDYSIESRSYRISSDNKAFIPNQGGYSIFASSLDGSDRGVRLEWYMEYERGDWKVDYCYLEEYVNE